MMRAPLVLVLSFTKVCGHFWGMANHALVSVVLACALCSSVLGSSSRLGSRILPHGELSTPVCSLSHSRSQHYYSYGTDIRLHGILWASCGGRNSVRGNAQP